MKITHKPIKPLSFLLILFTTIVFFNLVTFGHSRVTNLGRNFPKSVEHQPRITFADLTDTRKPGDEQGAVLLNGLNGQGSYGSSYGQGSYGSSYGYGYDNPYPGGIFAWPRGLFRFSRGFFRNPLGFFGYPGGYGGYPGGYGGYPSGYGGYSGGYGGGQQGGRPGYVGVVEVRGK